MQPKESSLVAFITLFCPIRCCQSSSTCLGFLHSCSHHQLMQNALNAWPLGLSWLYELRHSCCRSYIMITAESSCRIGSLLYMPSLLNVYIPGGLTLCAHYLWASQNNRYTKHYQLLEWKLSLLTDICCQLANTFSEWFKGEATKCNSISEAVILDYNFWFSRCFCYFHPK